MKPVVILLLSAVIFSACSKELSEEGGPGGVNPPVGDNCKISKLVEIDSTSGEGLFSNQTTFDANGRATAVRLYDSVLGNVDYATSIVYTGDTARISADEFFLLDANGRVRTFYSTNNAGGIAVTRRVTSLPGSSSSRQSPSHFSDMPIPGVMETWQRCWGRRSVPGPRLMYSPQRWNIIPP
jgi:hypothetical protein